MSRRAKTPNSRPSASDPRFSTDLSADNPFLTSDRASYNSGAAEKSLRTVLRQAFGERRLVGGASEGRRSCLDGSL